MSKSVCETRAATILPQNSGRQPGDSSGAMSKLYQCRHKSLIENFNQTKYGMMSLTHSPQAPPTLECLSKPRISSDDINPKRMISTHISTTRILMCSLAWYQHPEEYRLCTGVSVKDLSWGETLTIRLDQGTESIEKPAVAIELLLVLLFQTEDDLNRADACRHLPSLRDDNI